MSLFTLERKLKSLLKKILGRKAKEINQHLRVTLTPDLSLGDYSTNLLFLLQKYAPEAKELIRSQIKKWEGNYFQKVEILPNNFLNFYLSDYFLIKNFRKFAKNIPKYFQSNRGRKRKINLEFVSANPTGPLTLGNGRSLVFGNTLAEILKLNGFRVVKEYYVNDRGRQIRILGDSIKAVLFPSLKAEEIYRGAYIREVAQKLKRKISLADPPEKVGQLAAELILAEYIKPIIKKFAVNYDSFVFESELYQTNLPKKILTFYQKHNLLAEKEGALWLLLSKIGEQKDEVLIRKNGEETYFFSDIIYHYQKLKIRKFNYAITIVGADHLDHVRRLKKALAILGIKESQVKTIIYQLVNLKKGDTLMRMSKRKGIFVTLAELVKEIGLGPTVVYFLKTAPETPLMIDLEIAKKESSENPYWYLEYAYVRFNQILEKAKSFGYRERKIDYQKMAQELVVKEPYRKLMREIILLKDLLELISINLSANLFGEELIKFAKLMHQFYETERVLTKPLSDRKLKFVKIVRDTLGFFLGLLNLPKLEKM